MTQSLFLNHRTIGAWKQIAQTTHQARLKRLLDQADTYLTRRPPAEHPSETITYIGMAVANLSLAYLLTDKPVYLDTAREWIRIAISYPHWGRAHMPDHDLDAGWLSFGLGLGYDWIGEHLPDDERDALRAKLFLQGTRLYEFAVESEGKWWSSAYWQNHNWICYAGLATVAYALEREHSEATTWSARAVENFRAVMSLLPEDGSDYEGVVYWCYGVVWLQIACDLIQQQTGLDLHTDFLRNTFYYRLYMSAPNLIDTADYGDCHDRRSAHSAAMTYRFAGAFRDGHAQWLAEYFERTGEWEREGREGLLRPGILPQAFLEFLWYDPAVEPTPIHDLPTTRVFPDVGLVCTRSSWDADATFLVFKCGAPSGNKAWTLGQALNRRLGWQTVNAGHNHPDENSFVLVRGHDYLAVDEGYSQAKQTRHHNTVLVDGQGQYHEGSYNCFRELGPEWAGKLDDWFIGDGIMYTRGEAAGAYDPALTLKHFTRQMLMLGDRHVILCDDLASQEPREFSWLLQTDVPAHSMGDHQFTCKANRTRLHIAQLKTSDALETCKVYEQEIVAYPSSSTPEWVLRHTQHTLALTTSRTTNARYLVILSIQDLDSAAPRIVPLPCAHGHAAEIATAEHRVAFGFASDGRKMKTPAFEADARWVSAELNARGDLLRVAAGDATAIWVAGHLRLSAPCSVCAAMSGDIWHIRASAPTWVSLWTPAEPASVEVNGKPVEFSFDRALGMARLLVSVGPSCIMFHV